MKRKKEENPVEERINDLNRKISILEWDLINIQRAETRTIKKQTLDAYRKELHNLIEINKPNL